jgi:hypothetical protein
MKKSVLALIFGLTLSSTSVFAQDANDTLVSTLAVTLSPTITVIRLLDTTTATAATGSFGSLASAAVSFAATIESVEAKGVNAKNELREEATIVIDLLADGRAVKMRDFKTLAATIADLKNNSEASLEISEAAERNEVSFEIMAVKAIMLATEV